MDEWTKTLVSTGAGFLAGLAAEPLKLLLTVWAKARQARSALYSDMGLTYHLLNRVVDICHGRADVSSSQQQNDRERAISVLNSVSTDVYEHYATNERTALFRLPEAAAIKDVYQAIRKASQEGRERGWADRYEDVCGVFDVYERYFKEGVLDVNLLLKDRAKHRDQTVDRVERYYGGKVTPPTESDDEMRPIIRDSRYCLPATHEGGISSLRKRVSSDSRKREEGPKQLP